MKSIYLLYAVCLVSACGNPPSERKDTEAASAQQPAKEENTKTLSLNNGVKWKINSEMKPHIQASETLLESYLNSKSNGYKALAVGLDAHTGMLIKSCSMQGPDHDALHLWLHPHMEKIKALSEARTDKEAAELVQEIQVSFSDFHRYFE